METTVENISRPGEAPEEGDWIRETTTFQGRVLSIIEREYHEPPEETP